MSLESVRPLDMQKLKEYVGLDSLRRELEDRLDEVKKKMEPLNEELVENFIQAGVQSTKFMDKTVYIHTQLWASVKEESKQIAAAVFKNNGLGDLVKEAVNAQTLSAYFRELQKEEKEGPIEIQEITKVTMESKLRIRR